jgi:spoIIIJ-associated protein
VASATDDPIQPAEPIDAGPAAAAQTAGEGGADDAADDAAVGADLLEREGEAAADYLEGLLDIIDADGDIDMDVDGDRAVVAVIGDRLRHLVGPGGAVLDALQELTRLAVARETGVRSRLMLDIGGYRARRRAELAKIGTQAAEKALATGEPVALTAMSAFERKVVHDAVAAAGLRSESDGVEPDRHVVVLPTRRDPDGAATADSSADAAADSMVDGAADTAADTAGAADTAEVAEVGEE